MLRSRDMLEVTYFRELLARFTRVLERVITYVPVQMAKGVVGEIDEE